MTDDIAELKVAQEHVDGLAKQVEGGLADIIQGLGLIQKRLDPANTDAWAGPQATSATLVNAANTLANAINSLASLAVTKQWQLYLERALNAEDEDDRYMYAVVQDLQNYLTLNCISLEATAMDFGPMAGLFKQGIIERVANACKICEMLVDGHRHMAVICKEAGIDHAAVMSGDKDALRAALKAAEEKTGTKINAYVYAKLGLSPDGDDPDTAAASVEVTTNQEIRDALGLG